MANPYKLYLKRVYYIQMNGEKCLRKFILTNETFNYNGCYKTGHAITRNITIAGIGEIEYNADEYASPQLMSCKFYNDIDGSSIERYNYPNNHKQDMYVHACMRFSILNNLENDPYWGVPIFYKWDGIKPVKVEAYDKDYPLIEGQTYSLIIPTIDKEALRKKGIYTSAQECESDNVVEVIDFSF